MMRTQVVLEAPSSDADRTRPSRHAGPAQGPPRPAGLPADRRCARAAAGLSASGTLVSGRDWCGSSPTLGPTDSVTVAKTESNGNPQSEKEREERKTAHSGESRRDGGKREENRERLKPASCR